MALSLAAPAHAQPTTPTGPTLLKSLVYVRAVRLTRLWKSPTVSVGDTWCWMPEVTFTVLGPVPLGSQFTVDYTKSTGAPWYSVECPTYKVEPGGYGRFQSPVAPGHADKRATLAIGTFGFKIRYANSLSGAHSTLMTGKFSVNKIHKGIATAAFKNQFEYTVNQDWRLPVGFLWYNMQNDPKVPYLTASMWIKGDSDDTRLAGYLFYNGKQIASTKSDGTAYKSFSLLATSGDTNDPTWEYWDFNFATTRVYNLDTESANNWDNVFFLDKNPGAYEVRVLRDGHLARTAKFTVGADGKIVDNGLSAKNNLGTLAFVLPVKVMGTTDGKWDPLAWKTGAFYGNPMQGFTAP
ncbi:hypothetical protein IAD21_03876 [Abditibacteriota bacterium]|nr:hypothetical protein IAD21_03876 [Abditibacteriota bacterium]